MSVEKFRQDRSRSPIVGWNGVHILFAVGQPGRRPGRARLVIDLVAADAGGPT